MATDAERARDERLRRDQADAQRGKAIYVVGTGGGAYIRAYECQQCFAPIRTEVYQQHLEWHRLIGEWDLSTGRALRAPEGEKI